MDVSATQGGIAEDSENEGPLDPTGRYQRCDEILGEGAYKRVYRACDIEEGNEVAWNQLRIHQLTKKEAQMILSEIEILQSIRNEHILNFYASWSTMSPNGNGGESIVFITELMSSGTLKQYLKKTLKGALKPKIVKSWCRQILQGLAYMHTHDPPIIHRDLKCDNIFINGNNGQLKIGDLGLAVVRHRTHVSSVLGTPEFMAPELYDEKYDEKIDIYALGMCVLEMVTKDYPYAECTNQAQIYRKVTQGIKPQALEHVQDSEIKNFINLCLDHDATTRPSAQQLLMSDFLKPCMAITLSAEASHPNSPSQHPIDGHESVEPLAHMAFSSSTLTIVPPSISARSSTKLMPDHIPPRIQTGTPALVPSHSGTIPAAEFTMTTVDVDNKTYHIRSNLLAQTPTSANQNPKVNPLQLEHEALPSNGVAADIAPAPAPMVPHTHSYSKMCSIQVMQYGEPVGNRLNLKMLCTCPDAVSREDSAGTPGTHEIKFPFDMDIDTPQDVVSEMIREQILSADDQDEATSRIQELVTGVLLTKQQKKARREEVEKKGREARLHAPQFVKQRSKSLAQPTAAIREAAKRSQAISLKKPHHRQLNVPPVSDWSQYGTPPTETRSEQFSSSVGSNSSFSWIGSAMNTTNSDQGYGTFFSQASRQPAPAINDAVFPPLQPQQLQQHGFRQDTSTNTKSKSATYSDILQLLTDNNQPLSPMLVPRNSPVPPRPKSVHDVSYDMPYAPSASLTLNASTSSVTKQPIDATRVRPSERPRSSSTATYSKDKGKDKGKDKDEDVGYTSPYRHGVSSSSTKGSHRRSPSADISRFVPQGMAIPTSHRAFDSPEPQRSSSFNAGKSYLDAGHSLGMYGTSFGRATPSNANGPLMSTMATMTSSTMATITTTTTTSPRMRPLVSAPQLITNNAPVVSTFENLGNKDNNRGNNNKASRSGRSDSGVSSGASSPPSAKLHDARPQQHQQQQVGTLHSVSVVVQHDKLSSLVNASMHSYVHPLPHTHTRTHTTMSEPLHLMSSSLSSEGLYPVMTNEAKKNIELWSDHVQQKSGEEMHHSHHGSVPSSSCPDMSDEEEIEDEDLKILKEQQRRELEWMQLQHEMQWEEMMKLKEQREKENESAGIRQVNEVNCGSWPKTIMDPL
ncbi:Serine/threonine-protein kinase wnk1 [Mortierella polycephala]|uniref:Serine/threonine-protein kinase wnk1 n=1 Tax=Mortierella polycephala TaxID=41804 RepID=A0A9P6PW28_9FUNG|nr:Serine/threonine-protein kinase wnk1 [Mortierella polycephala]